MASSCSIGAKISPAGCYDRRLSEVGQPVVHVVSAWAPKAAIDSLLKAPCDFFERVGIIGLDEVAYRLVGEIGIVQRIEMVILDHTRGGGEGEEVVHGRGDLERPFIAMAHHAL